MSKKETKTNAMRILDRLKIPYEHSSYESNDFIDGIHVANSLGLPHERVYKTLVTQGADKNYYVFVIRIEDELDLKKCARAAGVKSVAMIPVKDITAVTGYIRGGCTAIGMKKQYPILLSDKMCGADQVYVSGGRRGVQLRISPEDLARATGADFADITADQPVA